MVQLATHARLVCTCWLRPTTPAKGVEPVSPTNKKLQSTRTLSPMDESVLIAAAPLPWCLRRMGRTRLCEKTWEKFNEPELLHRLINL